MHIALIIVVFAIVLGIMVLIHEFGHFIVAKAFGVRVEAFAIGFGPRLFGYVYKGTDYRVNALPLGGYVKMAGEYTGTGREETVGETEMAWSPDADRTGHGAPDEFPSKPRWQRVCIALAGPMANFILAFFLLGFVYMRHHEVALYLQGPAVVDYVPLNTPTARAGVEAGDTIVSFNGHADPTWSSIQEEIALHAKSSLPFSFEHAGQVRTGEIPSRPTGAGGDFDPQMLSQLGLVPRMQSAAIGVEDVSAGMPAAQAGLKEGDELLSIDGLQLHSVQALLPYLQDHKGAPAMLEVRRGAQTLTLRAAPVLSPDSGTGEMSYHLGFKPTPVPTTVEQLPLGRAFSESWQDNKHDSTLILRVLKGMFTRQVSVRSLSGPVGMAQQIGFALSVGTWMVLQLMCTISINLGIFNLLPIPILDGGLIIFLAIEGTIRRDLSLEVKERVYQVAFVCLILFAAFVMFNDIARLHHS
jgi:regulator of sigma E protease